MRTQNTFPVGIIAIIFLMQGASLEAAMVYDTPVTGSDLADSRSGPADLVVSSPNWPSNVTVAWEITSISGGFHYKYTFTNFSSPDISHFILDLSDDAVGDDELLDPAAVTNVTTNGTAGAIEYNSYAPGSGGNPGLPGTIVGAKFNYSDISPLIVEFDSNRSPVWGDIYVKAGANNTTTGSQMWNNGLTNHSSMLKSDFIARPNGAIPEPTTCLLAILALPLLGKRKS